MHTVAQIDNEKELRRIYEPKERKAMSQRHIKAVRFGVEEHVQEFSPDEPISKSNFPSQMLIRKPMCEGSQNSESKGSRDKDLKTRGHNSNALTRKEVEARVKDLLRKFDIPLASEGEKTSNFKPRVDRTPSAKSSEYKEQSLMRDPYLDTSNAPVNLGMPTLEQGNDESIPDKETLTKNAHVSPIFTEFQSPPDHEALASISNSEMLREVFGEDWLIAKRDLIRLFNAKHRSPSTHPSANSMLKRQDDTNLQYSPTRPKRLQQFKSAYPTCSDSPRKPFIAGSILNGVTSKMQDNQSLSLALDKMQSKPLQSHEDIQSGEVVRFSSVSNRDKFTSTFKKRLLQHLQRLRLAEVSAIRAQEKSCMEICELNSRLIHLRENMKKSNGELKYDAASNTLSTIEVPPCWMAHEAYESGDIRESIIKNTHEIAEYVDELVAKRDKLLAQLQALHKKLKARDQALKVAEEDILSRKTYDSAGSPSNVNSSKKASRRDIDLQSSSEKHEVVENEAKVIVGRYVAKNLDDTLIGDPRVSRILQDVIELQSVREKQSTDHKHWMELAKSEANRRRRLFEEALETKLNEERERLSQEYEQYRYQALQTMASDIALQAGQGAALIHRMAELDTVRMQSAEMTISETMISPDVCLAALQRDLLQVIEENKRLHQKKTDQSKLLTSKLAQIEALKERASSLEKEAFSVDVLNSERSKIENEMKTKIEPEMRSLVWQNVVIENMVKDTYSESDTIEAAFNEAIEMVSKERSQVEASINAGLSALSEST